ncbi:MAG: hypothetical protein CME06_09455 [Gemmatimonadetes bacterium]|nr:hypothetical protein [Gemmatimonadota bacterium]
MLIVSPALGAPVVSADTDDPLRDVVRKIDALMSGELAGVQEDGQVVISQDEFDLYVAGRVDAVEGIDEARVSFGRGHMAVHLRVEPVALVSEDSALLRPFLELAEPQEIYFEEGLGTSSGRVQLTFRRASIGRIPLPRALIEGLLTTWLGAAETVRLNQAVPIWEGVEEVRVDPGRLVVRMAAGSNGERAREAGELEVQQ